MIRRVAGRGDCLERPEAGPACQQDVGIASSSGDRSVSEQPAQVPDGLTVIGVVVGQRDPAETAPCCDLRHELLDVVGQVRSGVDQPRRIAGNDPRVGAA